MTEPELHVVAGLGAVGHAIAELFNSMLRAVREQQYQLVAPWVVDHTKFERAFGAPLTTHRDAIRATLGWYATST